MGKVRKLILFPAKVALALILPSIILYLFFNIWPLIFSVYIAFTDANATNIASQPMIAELERVRANITNYLYSNKDSILAEVSRAKEYINQTIKNMEDLLTYVNSSTTITYDGIDALKTNITASLTRAVSIVVSNETMLYYYPGLRDALSTAQNLMYSMWSDVERIIGFSILIPPDKAEQIKDTIVKSSPAIIGNLSLAYGELTAIEENYDSFVKSAVSDIDKQINRLSLHFIGLGNFQKLFSDSRFPYSILKTLLFVVTSVPMKLALGVALAFLFSSNLMSGRKVMRALLLIPWALPVLLTVTTWRMLFIPDTGVFSSALSGVLGYEFNIYYHEWDAFAVYNIVEMWLGYPFVMTVTMGAIAGIPKELIEAAYIDGAGVFQRFRHVTLPLALRPILFAAILTTGASLQAFMVPLLINNGGPQGFLWVPGFKPVSGYTNEMMVLYGYKRAWIDQEFGLSAASYLVITLIFLLYAFVWYKFVYRRGGR